MLRFRSLAWFAFGTALVSTSVVNAATVFTASLDPSQEVPPPVRISNGSGSGLVTLDPMTFLLSVDLSWQNLNAPASAAHIHCCAPPGANAPVAVDFVPVGFPSVTTGTFMHVFDLNNTASYGGQYLNMVHGGNVIAARDAFVTGLNAGLTYLNIHTPAPLGYPAGEIRGQLEAIPEPSTYALLGTGLLGILAGARLRRRTPEPR
jgi:hypothetical protein